MVYGNVISYLNGQVRNPIKKALEAGDKDDVMRAVDYICDKYREMNALAVFYESKMKIDPALIKEFNEYMLENCSPVNYDQVK